eukprot:TRINITY_DN14468_c0_g1_i2.p1 TRINITY_DN14468_c0_g1~~TRINITY_DN14468_c0_g1_i2.p1  ORF type:complete len:2692 (+),score=798.91 TRINITY_DN14468_c0_g1_i2:41-8116(+)
MSDTAHTFISSSLQRILGIAKSKKFNMLVEKCTEALEVLQKIAEATKNQKKKLFPYADRITISIDKLTKDEKYTEWDILANLLVEPLLVACESHLTTLAEPALDCLQKLMDYGYIIAATPDINQSDQGTLIGRVLKSVTECSKFNWEGRPGEQVQLQIIKVFSTSITTPACGVHDTSLLDALITIFNIYLTSSSEVNRTTSRGALTHMCATLFDRISSQNPKNDKGEPVDSGELEEGEEASYNDCHLVFKTLCKFAKKEVTDPDKEIEIKSKILSLELILEIVGDLPIKNEYFIYNDIKPYLCSSLSQTIFFPFFNNSTKIFSHSLSIFVALARNFRKYLKTEISVFFGILMQLLQCASSSIQHKWLILRSLSSVLKCPQVLVDIFVNYDCDIDAKDLFGLVVETLARISQSPADSDPLTTPPQWNSVKSLALEGLIDICNSLVEFCNEIHMTPPSDIMNQKDDLMAKPVMVLPKVFEKFKARKNKKSILEKGKNLFKLNPKLGLKFLQENSIIQNTPESIAEFLRYSKGLDRVKTGEYLGDKRNLPVLHSYVDNHFDFSAKQIDIALREFLQWFRLPGEAQQIDRMMETFALRYYQDNQNQKNAFASTDAVYLLSFAIIMLATDHHNPMVIQKIRASEWKKHLIEAQQQFDPQVLDEIYDRVSAEPLRLLDDPVMSLRTNFLNERQRQTVFAQESVLIMKQAVLSIKAAKRTREKFYQINEVHIVHLIFEECWGSILAAFSVILESGENMNMLNYCLAGFKAAIRLSCIFSLDTQKDTFIRALTKSTSLIDNLHELQEKHFVAIKELIKISSIDGNYLGDSWLMVLRCISQLERMHISGSSFKADTGLGDVPQKQLTEEVNRKNAALVAERIRESDIDLVFSQTSKKLYSYAVIDIAKSLCELSKEELGLKPPRTFSLQKVVELSIENMHRSQEFWGAMWNLLGEHFSFAVSLQNKRVVTFAINALKQLCLKFLEDERLASYSFQQTFFKPFEVVANIKSRTLREYIVEILCAMVQARSYHIQSGWKSVLCVLAKQSSVSISEKIVGRSFGMLETSSNELFQMISPNYFNDLIMALTQYACKSKGGEFPLKAIKLIRNCAEKLAKGEVVPLIQEETTIPRLRFLGDSKQHLDLWLSVIYNLVKIVNMAPADKRVKALKVLFRILHTHGSSFDRNMWRYIFNEALSHLLDNVKGLSVFGVTNLEELPIVAENNDWLMTTCFKALHEIDILYEKFFDQIDFLLPDILTLFASCIVSDNETLSAFGIATYDTIISSNCLRFKEDNWAQICNSVTVILKQNLPHINQFTFPLTNVPPISIPAPAPVEETTTNSSGTARKLPMSARTASKQELKLKNRATNTPSIFQGILDLKPTNPDNVDPSPPMSARSINQRQTRNLKREDSSDDLSMEVDFTTTSSSSFKDKWNVISGILSSLQAFIKLVGDNIFGKCSDFLNLEHITEILDCLLAVNQFAIRITENYQLVEDITKSNKIGILNLLCALETESMNIYLHTVFNLIEDTGRSDSSLRSELGEHRLTSACSGIVTAYMNSISKYNSPSFHTSNTSPRSRFKKASASKALPEWKRVMESKVPVILFILEKVCSFSDEKLEKNLPFYFPIICDLTLSHSIALRTSVRTTLRRIGQIKIGQFSYVSLPTQDTLPQTPLFESTEKEEKESAIDYQELKTLPKFELPPIEPLSDIPEMDTNVGDTVLDNDIPATQTPDLPTITNGHVLEQNQDVAASVSVTGQADIVQKENGEVTVKDVLFQETLEVVASPQITVTQTEPIVEEEKTVEKGDNPIQIEVADGEHLSAIPQEDIVTEPLLPNTEVAAESSSTETNEEKLTQIPTEQSPSQDVEVNSLQKEMLKDGTSERVAEFDNTQEKQEVVEVENAVKEERLSLEEAEQEVKVVATVEVKPVVEEIATEEIKQEVKQEIGHQHTQEVAQPEDKQEAKEVDQEEVKQELKPLIEEIKHEESQQEESTKVEQELKKEVVEEKATKDHEVKQVEQEVVKQEVEEVKQVQQEVVKQEVEEGKQVQQVVKQEAEEVKQVQQVVKQEAEEVKQVQQVVKQEIEEVKQVQQEVVKQEVEEGKQVQQVVKQEAEEVKHVQQEAVQQEIEEVKHVQQVVKQEDHEVRQLEQEVVKQKVEEVKQVEQVTVAAVKQEIIVEEPKVNQVEQETVTEDVEQVKQVVEHQSVEHQSVEQETKEVKQVVEQETKHKENQENKEVKQEIIKEDNQVKEDTDQITKQEDNHQVKQVEQEAVEQDTKEIKEDNQELKQVVEQEIKHEENQQNKEAKQELIKGDNQEKKEVEQEQLVDLPTQQVAQQQEVKQVEQAENEEKAVQEIKEVKQEQELLQQDLELTVIPLKEEKQLVEQEVEHVVNPEDKQSKQEDPAQQTEETFKKEENPSQQDKDNVEENTSNQQILPPKEVDQPQISQPDKEISNENKEQDSNQTIQTEQDQHVEREPIQQPLVNTTEEQKEKTTQETVPEQHKEVKVIETEHLKENVALDTDIKKEEQDKVEEIQQPKEQVHTEQLQETNGVVTKEDPKEHQDVPKQIPSTTQQDLPQDQTTKPQDHEDQQTTLKEQQDMGLQNDLKTSEPPLHPEEPENTNKTNHQINQENGQQVVESKLDTQQDLSNIEQQKTIGAAHSETHQDLKEVPEISQNTVSPAESTLINTEESTGQDEVTPQQIPVAD